jgi:epoxide hydrolase-like predicted phosphatase
MNQSDPLAVIFDWGGVLMRTHDHARRHAWDVRLGLPPGSVERVVHGSEAWLCAQRGEITDEAYWQAVANELGVGAEALTRLQADFYADDHLDDDLIAFIRELRSNGVKVGLLSNNSAALLDELAALGVADAFASCVISAVTGVMKPDPAAYHAILDALGVSPERALFIDDTLANVEGARAVGMVAVLYRPDVSLQQIVADWLAHDD